MKNSSENIQHREHSRRLRQATHFDEVTGLPNRASLGERLRKAIAQSKRWGQLLAVARLNLDGLEGVDDLYGSETVDLVLASLARGMKRTLRKADTLARLEGGGFAAVFLDLQDMQASIPVLQRLLRMAAEPVNVGEASIQLSASIGVTFYPQEQDADADELLRQASKAMRNAHAAGKNRYHIYDIAPELRAGGNPESLDHIRQALAAREFLLFFQPKVNMATGQVAGVEALIRWKHPQRGLLLPSHFLPLVEDHPLAVEIGEWVIGTALAQMEEWLDAGLEIPVGVNVGSRQLQQPGFAEVLAKLLSEHPRIHPSHLELDIQESNPLEDAAQLCAQLIKCRATGVSLALDDFGAGHFSLAELKKMPVDVLKIDPMFVREILENPTDLAILEGILGLISAFQRQAVAEGVETVEQGLMLLRLGCAQAQGYGIGKPMRASEFPDWLATWRPDPRWSEAFAVEVDERPLLHAGVEHRAWAASLEAFLKNESDQEPRLSRYQCQFGAWLYGEGPAGRSSLPAFQPIVALHWRIHALAAGIVKFHNQGRNDEGLARLDELKDLVDKLADMLNSFGQRCEPLERDEAVQAQ